MGLRDLVRGVARKAVSLPVVSDRVIGSPALERQAAVGDLVPKRCGLCKSFSRDRWEQLVQREPTFQQAMSLLSPSMMGRVKTVAYTSPGSAAARELRPMLTERWEDYGVCLLHESRGGPAIWAFAEQPPMPQDDSEPCVRWT